MKKYFVIIPVLLVLYFITLDISKELGEILFFRDNFAQIVADVNNDSEKKMVLVSVNDAEESLYIDDYILGVVACEVPALFPVEALKSMAIVSRTFYSYKDNNSQGYVAKNSDQCFNDENDMREKWGENFDKYYNIIKKAIDDTSNLYITYDNELIESFYFSISNGMTENIENVFSEVRPYLVSVDSSWDQNVKNFSYEKVFSRNEFFEKLNIQISDNLDVQVVSKSTSGRINELLINGVKFKGTELRKLLGIRSTDFTIDSVEGNIVITTKGYGHGVGMSQYGANEMAKSGYNYEDIIKHYYTGVEIKSL